MSDELHDFIMKLFKEWENQIYHTPWLDAKVIKLSELKEEYLALSSE
jgi:hypothetical protein